MINKLRMFLFYKHKVGGLLGPDPKDERDLLASVLLPTAETLPDSFNLIDKMTSIQSQFYGSCTSHSVDGVKEYQETLEEGSEIKLANRFIYHNTKVLSGLWDNEGDYLRTAVKAVEKYGVPLEYEFIDTPEASWKQYVTKKPSDEVYLKALKYKAKGYLRVDNNLEAFKNALYQNKTPVACGMSWFKSMNKPDADGKISLPSGTSGGHAISFVGWDGNKNWFRNSWGTNWGLNGYFYILTNEFSKYDFWDGWILFDLPNDWISKVKSMHKRYITPEKEQYFKDGDKFFHIPDSDTLDYLIKRKWVTEEITPITTVELTEVEEMPLSKRAYDYVLQGKEVFDDLFRGGGR